MARFKIIIAAVLAILLIVVVAQNTEAVSTRLLFLTITMPRAILLLVTMLIGFVLGLVAAPVLGARSRKAPG